MVYDFGAMFRQIGLRLKNDISATGFCVTRFGNALFGEHGDEQVQSCGGRKGVYAAVGHHSGDCRRKAVSHGCVCREIFHRTFRRIKAGDGHDACCHIAAEADPLRCPSGSGIRAIAMPATGREDEQHSGFQRKTSPVEFRLASPRLDQDQLPFVQDAAMLPAEIVFVGVVVRRILCTGLRTDFASASDEQSP